MVLEMLDFLESRVVGERLVEAVLGLFFLVAVKFLTQVPGE
jgi:hypothetical protein